MKTVLAFDFGASSGRAIKANYDGTKITYKEIHRFENNPIIRNGQVHHDVDMIFCEIKKAKTFSIYTSNSFTEPRSIYSGMNFFEISQFSLPSN